MMERSIQQTFEVALRHHQSGRLTEAEALYRQVLAVAPREPSARHLLGVIAHQTGRNEDALTLLREAIALDASVAAFHSNLGLVLAALGNFTEALNAFRTAVQLQPDSAEIHNNLGNALRAHDQIDSAIAAYRKAVQCDQNFTAGYFNLGMALSDSGATEDAISAYRRAIACTPNFPEAQNNLGLALKSSGDLDGAISAYQRAISLRPGYPEAWNNLGNALRARGRTEESARAFRQALGARPDFPEASCNLGALLDDLGQANEAVAHFRHALSLKPDFPEAHYNLGNSLKAKGQLDEAIASFRQAIRLRPGYAEAENNLGIALKDCGQLTEACAAFRRAMTLGPTNSKAGSNLVYSLHFQPGLDAQSLLQEHLEWSRRFEQPLLAFIPPHSNDRSPERRLRIGYVSPDFRDHVVGRNLLPALERHDRNSFAVFCYANVTKRDGLTERFQRCADVWRDVTCLTNHALADLVRTDQIDILIDLTLHMENNRLEVFARKPAPVQVTWAGYPGTTGLHSMDYRLTDPYLDPPEKFDADYTEQSVRLRDSFWCYDPLTEAPAVNRLPALSAGSVTFGSLNNFCKVNAGVIELWSNILRNVPASRLLFLCPEGAHRQRTLEAFTRSGVEADRIAWFTPAPRAAYFAAYHRIDLGLDTFPYNGHTTSLDSFWMGVPVVTLVGKTIVGRGGLSQATNLGLPELVATTEGDYLQRATELANDLRRLADLRQTLRERMLKSPLADIPRFMASLEGSYRTMWRTWCAQ